METNKPRNFKDQIPPPKVTPAVGARIGKKAAISFLAEKTRTSGETWRAARDRVAHRVKDAIGNGSLQFEDDEIIFGKLIAWAKTTKGDWKERLEGVGQIFDDVLVDGVRVQDNSFCRLQYGNLENANKQHLTKDELIERTERRVEELKKRNAQLEPKAARYEENCAQNRENARKPRKQTP